MLNTHGIKIRNIRKVSGETCTCYRGYVQISYDRATGELLSDYHYNGPVESWTEYNDPDVITICNTRRHMTMQQLADAVLDRLAEEAAHAASPA